MAGLKIRVENEVESEMVQKLLFELGYKWADKGKVVLPMCGFKYIGIFPDGMHLGVGTGENNHKEVTIQSLRDTVVLKRNDVNDATHFDSSVGSEKLHCRKIGDWWYLFTGGEWQKHCYVSSGRADFMVPIKKKMKEYLKKHGDGAYSLMDGAGYSGQSNWTEVPEGSEAACVNQEGSLNFYKKIGEKWALKNNFCWTEWYIPNAVKLPRGYDPYSGDLKLVWEREPIIDDEQSLNDQVATAEEYRQEIKIVEEYDPVVRTVETYKVLTGITMDEQVARSFIAVYELAKQLKG